MDDLSIVNPQDLMGGQAGGMVGGGEPQHLINIGDDPNDEAA